jgi:N-acetylglutamate synthase-like GNAT family acetyltransferase
MKVRTLKDTDKNLRDVIELYRYLNAEDSFLTFDDATRQHWNKIVNNPFMYFPAVEYNNITVSCCALTIILNISRNMKSYAVIENVVTHIDYRQRGFGTQVLRKALNIAEEQNCYKVMLFTGSKRESTLKFYQKAGFEMGDKTGFVWYPGKLPG